MKVHLNDSERALIDGALELLYTLAGGVAAHKALKGVRAAYVCEKHNTPIDVFGETMCWKCHVEWWHKEETLEILSPYRHNWMGIASKHPLTIAYDRANYRRRPDSPWKRASGASIEEWRREGRLLRRHDDDEPWYLVQKHHGLLSITDPNQEFQYRRLDDTECLIPGPRGGLKAKRCPLE